MKAIVYQKFGPPEVLELKDVSLPKVKKDQVLIKVKATSVNPIDYKMRKGFAKPFSRLFLPKTPGGDFSGTVEEIGFHVKNFEVGQEVFGLTPAAKGGTYAEYAIINKEHLSNKPESLSFEEAASIPLAGLTAYQALYNQGKIKPQMRVFINGCTGGVGSYAVQIAKAYNCEVTGICSSKNVDFAKGLGVDYVVAYDKKNPLKVDNRFDIFFDVSGTYTYGKVKHLLYSTARYINLLPSPSLYFNALFKKEVKTFWVRSNRHDLENLAAMVDKNLLKPYLDRIYPLQEAVKAHTYCENNSVKGKVAITTADLV